CSLQFTLCSLCDCDVDLSDHQCDDQKLKWCYGSPPFLPSGDFQPLTRLNCCMVRLKVRLRAAQTPLPPQAPPVLHHIMRRRRGQPLLALHALALFHGAIMTNPVSMMLGAFPFQSLG